MKRGYSKILYNQRNKDETIVSVIKRLFGEHISSRLIRMQNRELTFRCITYNLHRMLNLIIIKWILLSQVIVKYEYIKSCILNTSSNQSNILWFDNEGAPD